MSGSTSHRAQAAAWLIVLGILSPLSVGADNFVADPLILVSGASPFGGCTADDVIGQTQLGGQNYPASEVEPSLAVNPTNPNNIVGVWQQDRWSNGGARGLVAGVSFDGGLSWIRVVIPNLSLCSGGALQRVSDPWLSFAPNGDLYLSSLAFDSPGFPGFSGVILVSKSTDGGLTWSAPVTVEGLDPRFVTDKETITVDPTDARLGYVVWTRLISPPGTQSRRADVNRLLGLTGTRGPAVFSRTTDGGLTWDPARVIYEPGGNAVTESHQIVVLPDTGGTLINFFSEFLAFKNSDHGPKFDSNLVLVRSPDKGETWLPHGQPSRIAKMFGLGIFDPDTGASVRSAAHIAPFFDVAVDRVTGALYAVWQDARFSDFVHDSIAFTMSTDGGLTWSAPIRVNRTPTNVPPGNQQAWNPSVSVAADGTVAVSYYDFRNNTPVPNTLETDYWVAHCHPTTPTACADPAHWGDEVRLTAASFDIKQAPFVRDELFGSGFFIGDYVGHTSVENDFLTLFPQSGAADPANAFFGRIRR